MASHDVAATAGSTLPDAKMTTPYSTLSKVLTFGDGDQEFWWHTYAPILSELLIGAKYDVHRQYQNLAFFHAHVLPWLGPRPDGRRGFFRTSVATGGQPVEMSINFQRDRATARYAFEPLSYQTRKDRDVFGNIAVREMLNSFARVGQKFDQPTYDHFTQALAVSRKEGEAVLQDKELVQALPTLSEQCVSVEIKDQTYVKFYSYPQIKSAISGVTVSKLMFDSIKSWHVATSNDDAQKNVSSAISELQEYFKFPDRTSGSNSPPSPDVVIPFLFSCDLDVGASSRAKIYVADTHVNFAHAEALWTLDGRLNSDPDVATGLDLLRELWRLLRIPDHVASLMPEDRARSPRPLTFNYEVSPASPAPVPKAYIGVIGLSGAQVVEGVTAFLKQLGWDDHAQSYKDMIARVYAGENLEERFDIFTWVSFAYSAKTGPYVTSYFYAVDLP